WALISLLGYMVILHARSINWLRDFGTAVGAILGFWLILMTWYGVNFVLASGLHSYGFGSGGGMYVLIYLGLELLFLVLAGWKYRLFQNEEMNRIAASAAAK
ncbi:MAG: ABC transporter permease, partial [Candidatus Omnitrophota bacterium]